MLTHMMAIHLCRSPLGKILTSPALSEMSDPTIVKVEAEVSLQRFLYFIAEAFLRPSLLLKIVYHILSRCKSEQL